MWNWWSAPLNYFKAVLLQKLKIKQKTKHNFFVRGEYSLDMDTDCDACDQSIFICVAPIHNKSHVTTLSKWSRSNSSNKYGRTLLSSEGETSTPTFKRFTLSKGRLKEWKGEDTWLHVNRNIHVHQKRKYLNRTIVIFKIRTWENSSLLLQSVNIYGGCGEVAGIKKGTKPGNLRERIFQSVR